MKKIASALRTRVYQQPGRKQPSIQLYIEVNVSDDLTAARTLAEGAKGTIRKAEIIDSEEHTGSIEIHGLSETLAVQYLQNLALAGAGLAVPGAEKADDSKGKASDATQSAGL